MSRQRYIVTVEIPDNVEPMKTYALEMKLESAVVDYVYGQVNRDLHDDEVIVDVERVEE
jgi:hypothetical protein